MKVRRVIPPASKMTDRGPSAGRAADRVPTTVPKMAAAKLAEPSAGRAAGRVPTTAPKMVAAKLAELVVERRGACSSRGRYVFVPGRVRLAVPLSAMFGASPPRVLAYLLFDGTHLEISAALADAPVFVSGERASGSWRAVPVPSILRVGDEEFDVRAAPSRQSPSTSALEVFVRGATVKQLDATVLPPTTADPEITVHGLPIAAITTSTSRDARPAHRAQTTGSSRRWRRLALLSGALVAALAAMLLVGGPRSVQAIPHVGTAQASGPSARPPAAAKASASSSNSAQTPSQAIAAPSSSASATTPRASASAAPPPSPPAGTASGTSGPASAQGVHSGTTLERRAADLFARGAFTEAATVYRELGRQHPERPIFTEAAAMATQHAAH